MGDREELPAAAREAASKEGGKARRLWVAYRDAWKFSASEGPDAEDDAAIAGAFVAWYTSLLARSWADEVAQDQNLTGPP
jgi:hypothetical protein